MDKRLRRLLCMLLGLVLLLGSFGTASAAGKRNNRLEINDLGDRMDDWYYVSSTVPKEYLNQEKTELRIATNDGSDYNPEYAQTCEITFKKGDEALKDALVAAQEGDRWYAYVDNGALTAPGKAVFHFKAESESYVYERDFTINVLDWNEHPLLKVVNDHPVIEAKVGQQITDDQVMAAVGEFYTADIFDNVLKLKARSWMASDYFIPRSNSDVVFEGDKLSRVYVPSFLISRYNTQVNDYGENEAEFVYTKGNIRAAVPVVFSVRGYVLSGDQSPVPGGTVQFSVTGSTEGRTFTWSVEGDGATIDEKTGTMTVASDAAVGTIFTVTAKSSDGDEISTKAVVSDGVVSGMKFKLDSQRGFSIPEPVGDGWNAAGDNFKDYYGLLSMTEYQDGKVYYSVDAKLFTMNGFDYLPGGYAENPEKAREFLEKEMANGENPDLTNAQAEYIEIDGHPALLETYTYSEKGNFQSHIGIIYYIRNNYLSRLRFFSIPVNGAGPEDTPRVTMEDMKALAFQYQYDETQAPFTSANAAITITAKDNATTVTAGKQLQFTAAFADADSINRKAKNDAVVWSVTNAESGAEEPSATISANGQLKIDKNLEAPVQLAVKAASGIYGTEAICQVTAMPIVSKVTVEPAELFFYVGTEEPQNVKALLEPATVPPVGITWTPAKKDIIEITDVADGEVSIKPLAAGKTTIAVKEPGGKNAKLNVSVVQPVESVTLTVKGNIKPGGSVNVAADLQPKQAGNKNLEWSVDVGEDVATINAKGQVKISKEAASGTKITVTCKALGAPEPIVSTTEIEIP